ncbi:MAG: glycosyltransferase family 2 protein [Phycisphaerales bacterium]|nr:glycosyltransferase family 2 protein [Phycisphaerales bacterium]
MPQPESPLPLSVAIVCKNNEQTIGRTLDSVKGLAAEIVAVDSGSTDSTIPMLEEAGARIVRSEWLGHIKTKQKALELCTQPWALSIDSDESVEPELAASIRKALTENDPGVVACRVNRKVWYLGRFLNHAWQPEWRTRLVRRELTPGKVRWGGVDPHDKLMVDPGAGRVLDLEGALRHDTIADFASFLEAQVRLSRVSASSLREAGRGSSAWKLMTSPPGAFLKQMVLKSAWRDGWRGWCAAGSAAAATLMKQIILLDLQGRRSEGREGDGRGEPPRFPTDGGARPDSEPGDTVPGPGKGGSGSPARSA